ncbi:cellulase family glycosylhydrolase [Comamonas badia]|uniref:cellulase family glycosylhydrolase n=1 Tax=Comamonas badia TaxID=265291 RepID=UPI0003F4C8F5|nr:cellulase family glycosylhydrolase [Comamonas badia]
MKILQTLFFCSALALFGCGGGDDTAVGGNPPANTDISQRIYVLSADAGQAGALAIGQEIDVTLTGVEPGVDWYSDRPARESGETGVDRFIGTDWKEVYASVAPNALLQYHNASGVHGVFGSVQAASYDAPSRTLRLGLRVAQVSPQAGTSLGSFSLPVLTLLNNLQAPAQGSTFAMAGGDVALQPDGKGGQRLVLRNVDSNVLWMNNAPARSGDFEALGHFVNLWDERFGDALPNASVAGDPGDGDYDIYPMTLSDPVYDSATHGLSFAAVQLGGADIPAKGSLSNAVLFIDAGDRASPSSVFEKAWRGVAYSAVPASYTSAPKQYQPFFDSDTTADAFQAQWGSKGGCGRNDLEAMAAQGVNLVRLYDYNYQRGSTDWETAGKGHIAFLDKAQELGIKVIIPISNYNFKDRDGSIQPWSKIGNTVKQIVESVKKNGAIHPAVHSFSIGNELDLNKDGETWQTLIPKAVQVAKLIHQLAPDHYMSVPLSTADQNKFYAMLRDQLPPEIYNGHFYNSVQTFKRKDGGALENDILKSYDSQNLGVPLVITELGFNNIEAGSVDAKMDIVLGQASAVRGYMDANPQSLVKGFAIFEWQNANSKRNGGPDNTESTFGIQSYGGTLCQSKTGVFGMGHTVAGKYDWAHFHDDLTYDVDKLVPLTSSAHPEGLLPALSAYFR